MAEDRTPREDGIAALIPCPPDEQEQSSRRGRPQGKTIPKRDFGSDRRDGKKKVTTFHPRQFN